MCFIRWAHLFGAVAVVVRHDFNESLTLDGSVMCLPSDLMGLLRAENASIEVYMH